MISNIVDRRTNIYDVRCDVVFEAACHDNSIKDATQFDTDNRGFCQYYSNTTVYSALMKSMNMEGCITLYLYDVGTHRKGYVYDSKTGETHEVEIDIFDRCLILDEEEINSKGEEDEQSGEGSTGS